ncbi:kinase-like domain-containing protein [Rhizophagus clarus]|uniref:Kinase-like domain-containing protein n=1 Tax=Rhizophagus clarus TaxID=94130 RepID=A0A8H3QXD6_9GLOM|nr:kinase-like domain-containing protein [Rhizophagus clarus]
MAHGNNKVSSSAEESKAHWYGYGWFHEFLNEWDCHKTLCLASTKIILLYGFTKNPDTLNYMAVMDYANKAYYTSRLLNFTSMKNWMNCKRY